MPRDAVGLAARAYDLAFGLALPFLHRNRRLADGWDQRTLAALPPRADLWLQAASAGEALLAVEILKRLGPAVFGPPGAPDSGSSGEPDTPSAPLTVLATSGTRQGLDILAKAAKHGEGIDPPAGGPHRLLSPGPAPDHGKGRGRRGPPGHGPGGGGNLARPAHGPGPGRNPGLHPERPHHHPQPGPLPALARAVARPGPGPGPGHLPG